MNSHSTTNPIASFSTMLLRSLICLTFVAVPLNPYIGSMTCYLWGALIFFDVTFLRRLYSSLRPDILLFIFYWLAICLICLQPVLAVKTLVLMAGVAYLCLMYGEIRNTLFFFIYLSIVVCIVQFICYFIDRNLSYLLGPTSISSFIWGSYATPVFTNQYKLLLLPRMSGLSREAGFFASFLIVAFLVRLREGHLRLWEKALFLCGYLFSLSKISLSLFLLGLFLLCKKVLKVIPGYLMFIVLLLMCTLLALGLAVDQSAFFIQNQSLAHRLSAYFLSTDMDWQSFITGCKDYTRCFSLQSQPLLDYLKSQNLQPLVGFSGVIINLGLLGLMGVLAGIIIFKLDGLDVLLLFIFTFTVSLFTIDNFVVLGYFYIFTNKVGRRVWQRNN